MFQNPRNIFIITTALLVGFIQILFPIPVPLHYVFVFFSLLVVFKAKDMGMKVNMACAAFLVAGAISIMGNDIPDFFKPWSRYMLFAMMMIGCSPLLRGPEIDKVKRQIYMGGLWTMGIVAVLSFVGYFAGFGQRMWGFVNSYMGITGHANFLGFFTMIAMVWAATMFFRCTKMKERYIVIGGWVACLITLLLCASRSALACGLVGTIMAIYLRFQKNATALMNSVVIAVIAVILSLPYLLPYMEVMMKKNMNFDDTDSMVADTRGSIWELRYQELDSSPVIGIGAYACDITLPNADIFYNKENGSIELGSSYLGLLAQCGWLGFICFLLTAIPICWKTYKYSFKERTPYAQLWFPMLFTCGAHMSFEGYLMTAGAVQCIIVWMVLGAADMCDTVADYPVAWEKDDPITPEEYVRWREANGITDR